MGNHSVVKKMLRFFLAEYDSDSYVVQQKAFVLCLTQLILIPLVIGLFWINLAREPFPDRFEMITIDLALIITMAAGLFCLRSGNYRAAVNLNIFSATAITLIGWLVKQAMLQEIGVNHFAVVFLATIVFTSMFGSRRVLTGIALLFMLTNFISYAISIKQMHPYYRPYLQSMTLLTALTILIVYCLTHLNGLITDRALRKTRDELDKNIDLNRTLEEKVHQRTIELKAKNKERKKLIKELQASLEEINTLGGLLPICAKCKRIRDDQGYWNQIEAYISDHSKAVFSHSICPDCASKLYPSL